jgi:PAS domain S-box-containing protein
MRDSLRDLLQKPLARYLSGVIAVGLAFIVREVLSIAVDPGFSEYLLFYPTVMIVALLAGIWPALLAVVAAAGLIVFRGAVPLSGDLFVPRTTNFLNLVLFMAVCAFLSVVAELYRRSREKAAAYDKELALRESQAAVRQQAELLKLSFDAIIVWRMGGWIESWNRGAEELYGFSESEALGRDIHELLRTSHQMSRPEFEALLQERRQWDGELRHLTREGRRVIASSRLHIGSGIDGTERVLQIDRDVTEQKRVQEELQRAHDELEEKVQQRTADLQKANRTLMMVSQCDQALVQVTDERELTAVICQIIQDEGDYPLAWVGLAEGGNGHAEKIRCTASAGDFDGFLDGIRRSWGDFAMGSGPPVQAIRSGAPVVSQLDTDASGDYPWRDAALSRGFKTMAAFPLLSARRSAFGALVIYSDRHSDFEKGQLSLLKELADDLAFGITSLQARAERDQAQRALEAKAAQLQVLAGEIVRTEERERQRIARLLHDQLQQLLAATLYRLESLRTAQGEAEHLESHTALSDQLRECIRISRSLTSELSHPALSEPDLTAALEWLAGWMKEKHGLSVEVRSAEALTVEMEEIRIMLLQAIRELLFNVVKHSGVKKALVQLGTAADGRLLVTVSDEGAGFDAASIADPGSRSGGIGLLSMRERLALTGGGIEIESSPGRGSRFTIWVPARFVKPVEERAAPPALADGGKPRRKRKASSAVLPRGEGKIRVLLVDDHTVVRNGIALQLRQHADIDIVGEASDGESAVDLVRRLRPDVVTMDVNMPGMSGIETARAIHAEFPGVAIIGLSMFDEEKQAAAMRDAGAVGYISKSASLESLLATIRACAGT